jgi:putative transposase
MYFHVWFVTKYRRKVLVGEVDSCVKKAFAEIAEKKGYSFLEVETDGDHVHMLVCVKRGDNLSSMMRVIKSVSAKKALEFLSKSGTSFWAPRYKWRKVPAKQLDVVRTYIRNQKEKKEYGK